MDFVKTVKKINKFRISNILGQFIRHTINKKYGTNSFLK